MFWNKKPVETVAEEKPLIDDEHIWIEYSSKEPTMKDMKTEKRILEQSVSKLLDEFKLKFGVELKAEIVIQI